MNDDIASMEEALNYFSTIYSIIHLIMFLLNYVSQRIILYTTVHIIGRRGGAVVSTFTLQGKVGQLAFLYEVCMLAWVSYISYIYNATLQFLLYF